MEIAEELDLFDTSSVRMMGIKLLLAQSNEEEKVQEVSDSDSTLQLTLEDIKAEAYLNKVDSSAEQ